MKFILVVSLLSFSVASYGFSNETCANPKSLRDAKRAKAAVQDKLFQISGVNGVGITNCDVFWAQKTLGLKRPMVALPNKCGVHVTFVNKDAAQKVALRTMGRVMIPGASVPLCGQVVGIIRPL